MNDISRIAIFDVSPDGPQKLTKEVVSILEKQLELDNRNLIFLDEPLVHQFADGDKTIRLPEQDAEGDRSKFSIRNKNVYIFQYHMGDTCARVGELMLAINAARKGGKAKNITVVMPYCLGMRAERRTGPKQPVNFSVYMKALWAFGARGVVTQQLHAESSECLFDGIGVGTNDIQYEHFTSKYLIARVIQEDAHMRGLQSEEIVVGGPDDGSHKALVKPVSKLEYRHSDYKPGKAYADKSRPEDDNAEIDQIIGKVEGKVVYLIDDMLDTAGTMKVSVDAYIEHGARQVIPVVVHPVLGKGYEKKLEGILAKEEVPRMYVGDTIPLKKEAIHEKMYEIPSAPLLADGIRRIDKVLSLSELHRYDDQGDLYQRLGYMKDGMIARPVIRD